MAWFNAELHPAMNHALFLHDTAPPKQPPM
jgi:hypothetical protein